MNSLGQHKRTIYEDLKSLLAQILTKEVCNYWHKWSWYIYQVSFDTETFRILCCWCTVVSKERIGQKIYFNELIKKNSVQFGSLKHGFDIGVTLLIFNRSLGVHFPTPTVNKKQTCVL